MRKYCIEPRMPSYLPPGTPSVVLSEQQANIVRRAASGESIFFTGKAGTGKSLVLQKLVELEIPNMHFTALTGVAATHIQGVSSSLILKVWSFFLVFFCVTKKALI